MNIAVSVIIPTFNNERHVSDAIKGVLSQQFKEPVQLIIANDHSRDGTHEVIQSLLKASDIPDNFQVEYTLHEQNKGMMDNYNWALARCRGQYIAFCDADDYWIDPKKLDKEYRFLQHNEDFSAVCTNYFVNEPSEPEAGLADKELTPAEVLHHNPIGILTTMVRAEDLAQIRLDKSSLMNDFPMWLELLLKRGKIMKLKDYTAVYRVLEDSFSWRNDYDKRVIYLQNAVDLVSEYVNQFPIEKKERKRILFERYSYLINKVAEKDKKKAWRIFRTYLSETGMCSMGDIRYIGKILLAK